MPPHKIVVFVVDRQIQRAVPVSVQEVGVVPFLQQQLDPCHVVVFVTVVGRSIAVAVARH